ncbi:MAG: hypothetical protein AB1779_06860 [Candidatus Thermoplasmatota archaeon]
MTIRITLRDADTGSKVEMVLEDHNTVEEIIESAASYWEKELGAYVLRSGSRIIKGKAGVDQSDIREGDVLELIPDPEGGREFAKATN